MAGEARDPELWRELSDYATQWFPSPGIAFADVHGALAHAFAGNADALAKIVDGAKGPAKDVVAPDRARLPRLRPLGLDRGQRPSCRPSWPRTSASAAAAPSATSSNMRWSCLCCAPGRIEEARRLLQTRRLASRPGGWPIHGI